MTWLILEELDSPMPDNTTATSSTSTAPPTPEEDLTTAAIIALEACIEILEANCRANLDIENATNRCESLEVENRLLRQQINEAQRVMRQKAMELSLLLHAQLGQAAPYQ